MRPQVPLVVARSRSASRLNGRVRFRGFTLIELLITIGIILVLIGILVPVTIAARKSARTTQCASNLRQVTHALVTYANQFNGSFPPNVGAWQQFWYTDNLIGQYLKSGDVLEDGARARGVLLCPNDVEGAVRSYSLNVFASGAVSPFVLDSINKETPPRGKMFKLGVAESSNMILITESFSLDPSPEPPLKQVGVTSPAIIGWGPKFPGQRFGTGIATKRWWQINYSRHRTGMGSSGIEEPFGRVNIGFVDGHVDLLAHAELADFSTGKSRYRAMWSTNDREID